MPRSVTIRAVGARSSSDSRARASYQLRALAVPVLSRQDAKRAMLAALLLSSGSDGRASAESARLRLSGRLGDRASAESTTVQNASRASRSRSRDATAYDTIAAERSS